MQTEPDQRFAPPSAHVEDVEVDSGELQLADRGTRLGAAMIDGAIAFVLVWAVSLATPWNPLDAGADLCTPRIPQTLAYFAAFVLLHGYLLAKRGQTIGKALLKIRIARTDGTAASLGRILGLRYGVIYLAYMVPLLGQAWGLLDPLLIFRRSKRCLHDSIADTIVVKNR
ncbi:MAG: RDD family protein [Ramlibacter sp.]